MADRERISSGAEYEGKYGYSRAVCVGDRVLVSGTAPIWPDGSCDEDPGAQTVRCIEIIETALVEAGATLADVVRTRMFVTDAAYSEAVGQAHGAAFADTPPATSMIVVSGLIDERWKVEIEAEAVKASR
jgi:enamine deaminase RidA (YjgF/YER057c/UK114 family)